MCAVLADHDRQRIIVTPLRHEQRPVTMTYFQYSTPGLTACLECKSFSKLLEVNALFLRVWRRASILKASAVAEE